MKMLSFAAYCLVLSLPKAVSAGGKIIENEQGGLVEFLGSIQDWLIGIVGALTILFIVYGGFLYITSGGNKERIEKAKKTLTYAILGLILVVLAGLIFEIITGDFLTSIFGNNELSY